MKMKGIYPLPFIMAVLGVVAVDSCLTGDEVANMCNCTFTSGMCCWQDNSSHGNIFKWELENNYPQVVSAAANSSVRNMSALLASPDICAAAGTHFSLQFISKIVATASNTCSFSVYAKARDGDTLLWMGDTLTNSWTRTYVSRNVTSIDTFQLIFEMRKMDISEYCKISIDDIVITMTPPISTSATVSTEITSPSGSPPSSETTVTSTLTSTLQSTSLTQGDPTGSLSTGAVAGIVVGIVVMVAVGVAIAVFIWRRVRGKAASPNGKDSGNLSRLQPANEVTVDDRYVNVRGNERSPVSQRASSGNYYNTVDDGYERPRDNNVPPPRPGESNTYSPLSRDSSGAIVTNYNAYAQLARTQLPTQSASYSTNDSQSTYLTPTLHIYGNDKHSPYVNQTFETTGDDTPAYLNMVPSTNSEKR